MSLLSEIKSMIVLGERVNNLATQVEKLATEVTTENQYLKQEIKDFGERLIRLEALSEADKNRPNETH